MAENPRLLWEPTEQWRRAATITRFSNWLESTRELELAEYRDLWQWSVTDLEAFWEAVWQYFDVQATAPYGQVLTRDTMPGAEWFAGSRLNYARHIFRSHPSDQVAIHFASEGHAPSTWTWDQLTVRTAEVAAGLRALGVEPGDVVAAYLPNTPETVAAFLACAAIGAVWTCAAPEFGIRAVVDRFSQVEPKVLLAVDGYRYGGQAYDRADAIIALRAQLPTVQRVVVIPLLAGKPVDDTLSWSELCQLGRHTELTFEEVPFDHPLWVLYSSGTTGLPKAIVHSQGGILLEQLKVSHLHLNAQAGDRIFWYTTTGWMMWNFLVGCLLTPASIVLYDGSPGHPDLNVLWDLAARTGVTHFGTSAGYLAACMKAQIRPRTGRQLYRPLSVGSTGSPLSPDAFRWVYSELGSDTWLFSTSGGTDLCTAFVGGVPTLPVYEGELQARSLGARVEAWDEAGRPLIGEVGELVLTRPMPSMPIYLWNDPGGERLRETYFAHYPGVWRHGDWIEITPRGTAIIYGRSDATINRGGVRMGTAEIYQAVLSIDEVVDALVVDLPKPGTEGWMPLFVVLRSGAVLDDRLTEAIRRVIRENCSPRHVPNEIRQVSAVPRTLSGKLLEVPVKRILMGQAVDRVVSLDAVANPESLDYFVALSQPG
ncbi:MAG TPA: acetoacetate--CoA ligase [Propionibacteriaceae bacterium]|nr:acetoacetate--CoA ligase [Propionibacteriaceae bacterium]